MKKPLALICALGLLLLTSCGTPPEVQALSTAQIGYFDSAIKAVNVQSEALVLAAGEIQKHAKARIEARSAANQADLKELLLKDPQANPKDQARLVDATLKSAAQTAMTTQAAIANLDRDLQQIREKSAELNKYITKMKDVQTTLNAYIQSEKAGDAVLKDVLKQPSVGGMISSLAETSERVTETASSITHLLSGLK